MERFTRSNDVLTLDNVYTLVCTDCLVLSDVYISLVVRIGLFRPNKVLAPVYKWICTLQLVKDKRVLCVESGLDLKVTAIKVLTGQEGLQQDRQNMFDSGIDVGERENGSRDEVHS